MPLPIIQAIAGFGYYEMLVKLFFLWYGLDWYEMFLGGLLWILLWKKLKQPQCLKTDLTQLNARN